MDKHTVQIILIGAMALFIVGRLITINYYARGGDSGGEAAAGFNATLIIITIGVIGVIAFFLSGAQVKEIGPIQRQKIDAKLFDFSK